MPKSAMTVADEVATRAKSLDRHLKKLEKRNLRSSFTQAEIEKTYVDLTRFSGQLISFRERSPKWEAKDHIQQHFVSKWSRWSDRVVVPTI